MQATLLPSLSLNLLFLVLHTTAHTTHIFLILSAYFIFMVVILLNSMPGHLVASLPTPVSLFFVNIFHFPEEKVGGTCLESVSLHILKACMHPAHYYLHTYTD
jgi:hypothetical protein